MDKLRVGRAIGFLCILFLFSTCRKAEDLEHSLENGNAELGLCAISEMTLPIPNLPQSATLKFAYNDKTDPVSVSASAPVIYTQWLFSYDKKNRLSQYRIVNADGSFQRWHIYFYDAMDRITGDSTYAIGLAGQRSTAGSSWFNQLIYDHKNRIVKEIETTPSQFFIIDYAYNAQGNLKSTLIDFNGADSIRTDAAGYVDQISILLTNKIWRFLARDYSIHSHSNAVSFTRSGLPTAFSGTNGSDIATFFFEFPTSTGLDIQYNCRDADPTVPYPPY